MASDYNLVLELIVHTVPVEPLELIYISRLNKAWHKTDLPLYAFMKYCLPTIEQLSSEEVFKAWTLESKGAYFRFYGHFCAIWFKRHCQGTLHKRPGYTELANKPCFRYIATVWDISLLDQLSLRDVGLLFLRMLWHPENRKIEYPVDFWECLFERAPSLLESFVVGLYHRFHTVDALRAYLSARASSFITSASWYALVFPDPTRKLDEYVLKRLELYFLYLNTVEKCSPKWSCNTCRSARFREDPRVGRLGCMGACEDNGGRMLSRAAFRHPPTTFIPIWRDPWDLGIADIRHPLAVFLHPSEYERIARYDN